MSDLSQMKGFSPTLAADLASGLYPAEQVFASHGVGKDEAQALLKNPHFVAMVKTARAEWSGVGNTSKRVKLKALMLIEEALPEIFGAIVNEQTPAAARAQMFKEVKSVAGIENSEEGSRAAALPTVTIYLGGENNSPVEVTPSKTIDSTDYEEASPVNELIWRGEE